MQVPAWLLGLLCALVWKASEAPGQGAWFVHKLCPVRRAADEGTQAVQKHRTTTHEPHEPYCKRYTSQRPVQQMSESEPTNARRSLNLNQTAESSEFDPVSLGTWAAEALER